jgi:hypothetical protein
MSTNPNIRLDDYFFMDQGNLYWRLVFRFQKYLLPIIPIIEIYPLLIKRKGTVWLRNWVFVTETAKATGLYDETFRPNFRRYEKAFYQFHFSFIAIFFILLLLVMGTIPVILFLLQQLFTSINGLFYFFLILLLFFSTLSALMRLGYTIPKRRFAEVLCVVGALHLSVQLTRDDVLPNLKEDVLYRLNSLANNLLLMGMKYSGSDDINKKWTYDHFNKISRFVRGLERVVIAPDENSLEKLRQGISRLGKIIISGQYGSFDFQISEMEKIDRIPKSLSIQIFTVIGKMISIAIPVSVLIFMFTSIDAFNQLNINRDSVFYIAVAWLLLALDDLIGGLGIVEKFLNLVKVSKELR